MATVHYLGLSMLVMTPVSAQLIANYGWQTAFFILGIISLAVMIPCAQLLKDPPRSEQLPLTPTSPIQELTRSKTKDFLLQSARRREFWLLLAIQVLLSITYVGVITHLVPHAIDLGIDPIQAASILGFMGAAGIAGKVVMGRTSDIIGRQNTMMFSSLCVAGAMLLLIWASDLWVLYLASLIFAFFAHGLPPVIAQLTGDTFGLHHIGLILGIMDVGWGIGAGIGPAMEGYVFDITGSYVPAFLTNTAAMLLAAASAFWLKKAGGKPS